MSDEIIEMVSLFTLMDAHLSKTALNEASENDENNPTVSDNLLSVSQRPKLAIPKFFPGNSPMKDFLAEKISMTLKAKAKQKEEEEQLRIVEEMKTLEINENPDMQGGRAKLSKNDEQEYLIDLTSSIIKQPKPGEVQCKSPKIDEACNRNLFTSQVDQMPSKSVSSSSCNMSSTAFGLYRSSMSETALTNDDSLPSHSTSDDYLDESSTMIMPMVDLDDEYEVPMTEEEENRLKMKQKEALWIEEELRKMRLRHQQEFPPLHLLDEMPQPKPARARPQPSFNDRVSKRLLFDKETCLYKEWDPTLPCSTDISYILNNGIKRGKCSTFGKVLCSRVQPKHRMTIPYARKKLKSNIVRFDFKTKSPGDIYKENQTSLIKNQTKTKLPLRFMLDLMECI